jgi:hypothetical protein
MGYLLQLIGALLIVAAFVGLLGGAAWLFLGDGDTPSRLLGLAWGLPGLLSLLAGIAFLRAGRKRLAEADGLATTTRGARRTGSR